MSQNQPNNSANSDNPSIEELERLLTEGVNLDQPACRLTCLTRLTSYTPRPTHSQKTKVTYRER